jgi:hypothetical protein
MVYGSRSSLRRREPFFFGAAWALARLTTTATDFRFLPLSRFDRPFSPVGEARRAGAIPLGE